MKILVFRIGQLGDTIVALPAIWAIRKHFKDASLTLLCDYHPGKNYPLGRDLLEGTGIFDSFEFYPVGGDALSRVLHPFRLLRLLVRLRKQKFDMGVYLAPSIRSGAQISRDRRFFRLAGIRKLIGTNNFPDLPLKVPNSPLAATAPEADLLLARLSNAGIPIPPANQGSTDLLLSSQDQQAVAEWQRQRVCNGQKIWVAFGPGSKMNAKRWPIERFRELGKKLIEQFDIWPVVFGGPEDQMTSDQLLASWGRGYRAAGHLGLRAAGAAIAKCALYVGNDTGTMHLAAAVGTPCVAIFSARDFPGMWFPYGKGHHVLRAQIECEGCMLVTCSQRDNECLKRIGAADVLSACHEILGRRGEHRPAPSQNSNPDDPLNLETLLITGSLERQPQAAVLDTDGV